MSAALLLACRGGAGDCQCASKCGCQEGASTSCLSGCDKVVAVRSIKISHQQQAPLILVSPLRNPIAIHNAVAEYARGRLDLIRHKLLLLLASISPAIQAALPPAPLPPSGKRPSAFDPKKLSDSERCALLEGATNRENTRMPTVIGTGLTVLHITNDCKRRLYEISYKIDGPISLASEGWRNAAQKQMNGAACNGSLSGPLVRHGWRFRHLYEFMDGKRLSFIAKCGT